MVDFKPPKERALSDLQETLADIGHFFNWEDQSYIPKSCEEFIAHNQALYAQLEQNLKDAEEHCSSQEWGHFGPSCQQDLRNLNVIKDMAEEILEAPFKKTGNMPPNALQLKKYTTSKEKLDAIKEDNEDTTENRDNFYQALQENKEAFKALLQSEGLEYIYENGFIVDQIDFASEQHKIENRQSKITAKDAGTQYSDPKVTTLRSTDDLLPEFKAALAESSTVLNGYYAETPTQTKDDLRQSAQTLERLFNQLGQNDISLDWNTKGEHERISKQFGALLREPEGP